MLPTEKMSTTPSPKKKSGDWGNLTAGEMKLVMASVLCMSGKLDTDKLGKLTSMKRKSAASRFPSAKRKLEKMFEDQLDTLGNENDSNVMEKAPARVKKRGDKVTESPEPEPEPKLEIKTETESGEGMSTDSPVKAEAESENSKVEADDIKIKPEPID
ncbi:uncharacterized protein N7518_008624 [Penicillium psychrosexuale]|uniref:uncharacterized protein n=1 Tax=Penicillium psychrosexuale TaxID=1002107 RepID=UPI0025456861|nr:uncharacterized protein N7518_008624 [Penicillium psychrosexuale]KAJ5791613.1 hypothetical protein N7518_008624 [Penicillium psychrosexuale]